MKLLVFPLSLELKNFVESLESRGHKALKTVVRGLPVYEFQTLNFRCALGGHGKVQFAVQTQFFLNHFQDSSAVYCIGSSGSLGSVKPLDVVIATETVEHDFNLKFVKRELPRFLGDEALVSSFRAAKPAGYSLHFGSVASGDEDVLNAQRAQTIKAQTEALVVAWEGAGGARVCKFFNMPFVEIRAVSDSADESAIQDFKNFLKASMDNIADLILQTNPI